MRILNFTLKTFIVFAFISFFLLPLHAQKTASRIQSDASYSPQRGAIQSSNSTVVTTKGDTLRKNVYFTSSQKIIAENNQKGINNTKGAASWNYDTNTGSLGTTYSWIDCSAGTDIGTGDDEQFSVSWPFDFSFYDDNYTTANSLSVCTNGFIRLDGTATTSHTIARNYDLSGGDYNLGQIIALGIYDNKVGDDDGWLKYLVTGTSPNRIFTVEYNHIEIDFENNKYADLQVSFYETTNIVVLKFGTENTNQNGADVGICSGIGTYYNYWGHVNGLADDRWIEYTPKAACSTPINQPTALNLTPSYTTIDGAFTTATDVPDGYLVVQSINNTLSATPVNGTTYSAGNALGGGTVVQSGSATTFSATGLSEDTEYYFYIFSQNHSGCSGGPVYLTTSPLTGNARTLVDVSSGCTIYSEDFNSFAIIKDLDGTDDWAYTEITNSPNDWGIASRTGNGNCLTIHNNNSAYTYNNGTAGEEIAYCTTPIDATNYKNLTISLDWQCEGQDDVYNNKKVPHVLIEKDTT